LIIILVHALCFFAYLSALTHILFPRSVKLFCTRMKDRPRIIRLLHRLFWVGARRHTVYGVGKRREAGLCEPFWRELLMIAAICIYIVALVKIFG
jgi:hypothetical protein